LFAYLRLATHLIDESPSLADPQATNTLFHRHSTHTSPNLLSILPSYLCLHIGSPCCAVGGCADSGCGVRNRSVIGRSTAKSSRPNKSSESFGKAVPSESETTVGAIHMSRSTAVCRSTVLPPPPLFAAIIIVGRTVCSLLPSSNRLPRTDSHMKFPNKPPPFAVSIRFSRLLPACNHFLCPLPPRLSLALVDSNRKVAHITNHTDSDPSNIVQSIDCSTFALLNFFFFFFCFFKPTSPSISRSVSLNCIKVFVAKKRMSRSST
jgi:hypothetical protein